VSKVLTTLTVTNIEDIARSRAGDIDSDEVRSATIEDVLVDTGATLLCLPADLIERLGLPFKREVEILTAAGPGRARVLGGVSLLVEGREGSFDCLEVPASTPALLGVVPLQTLGLQPDVAHERLELLPDHGPGTYLTVL
jgi:predicted aspartyl protease